jgi:hypothetical protein
MILTNGAFHGLPSLLGLLPRIFLTSDSAIPGGNPWFGWPDVCCPATSCVGPLPPKVTPRIAPRPRPYETDIAAVYVGISAIGAFKNLNPTIAGHS